MRHLSIWVKFLIFLFRNFRILIVIKNIYKLGYKKPIDKQRNRCYSIFIARDKKQID